MIKEFTETQSPPMQKIYGMIPDVAAANAAVLILGESGTGKEVLAKRIHEESPRKDKPFVVINCSAIPETLMESELFGHNKGAFTGATQDKKGLFEQAQGGTVFLDEIGEVPLTIQVKLLRVLQEKEIQKVGSVNTQKVDCRIIAATHRSLQERIEENLFREDLYYRLNVLSFTLPALRDRSVDLPGLIQHFLRKLSQKTQKKNLKLSEEALQTLLNYDWPGNIRELENVLERSAVLCEGEKIEWGSLPAKITGQKASGASSSLKFNLDWSNYTYKEAKRRALDHFHEHYLMQILQKTQGNISMASNIAGVDRSNFKKILKKYNSSLLRVDE